jgi:uncharacterized protein
MEFDWNNPPFNLDASVSLQGIEESFEDPFAVRLLPDSPRFSVQNEGIFSVYKTNGKQHHVIFARRFEPEEKLFYQRKLNQALAQ